MTTDRKRIAILEDDPAQAELLQSWLEEASYTFFLYPNGKSILQALKNESFDLLILDWELPDTTGVDIVKHVRDTISWHIPVLFTTNRDSEEDIVTALEAGADDYLIKPLRKGEMFARLNALSRRLKSVEEKNTHELTYAPYTLVPSGSIVKLGDKNIQLTSKEFELTMFLFNNSGRVLSRGHILESVWGQRADLNTRTVDTHMSLLRQKLSLRPQNGWRLSTIYRHGYRLEEVQELNN